MTRSSTTAAADLKAYIERIERIAQERSILGDDMKYVYAEAKAAGFDTKAMRRIVKTRAMDPAERAEGDSIFAAYMHALGMAADPLLHSAVAAMSVDAASRDDVISALQLLVPNSGEFIAKIGGKPLRIWRDADGVAHAAEYIEPKSAPAEKTGRSLKPSATILSVVPKDHVKAAADAAERRSKAKRSRDEGDEAADADESEPIE